MAEPVHYTRAMRRALEVENRGWPLTLKEIPEAAWPDAVRNPSAQFKSKLLQAWRSRGFLVQLYREPSGYLRMSVNRTTMDAEQRFAADLTWDELQTLKEQIGFGHMWAVECFPPDREVVNVQNMRHLFLLNEPPPYGWRKRGPNA
jgi:hypothetical protein